jgi:hypothetical protein
MKYGLEEQLQELTAYILGGTKVPFIPYQEDGNWEEFLPRYENQTTRAGQETSGCTVWGSQNQIEALHKRLYKDEPNYSERFTYLNVPVTPGRGTDPQNTYEAIRKHGLVDERDLPMTDSLEDYLDVSGITGSLRAKGQNWLVKHDYMHEWLWTQRPANYMDVLKEALKTSPLGVSVSAWNREGDVYVSYGSVNNHFCLLYKIDDEGYPWVFDSYDHSKKKLSKDHNIRRAKRIWINKRTVPAMKMHIKLLQDILKALNIMKPTLLDVCNANLGKDASPMDVADDSLACVDTATTILRQIRPETPHMVSTIQFDAYLANPASKYVRVDVPQPEDIIISPTQGKRTGHVGFFMEDGVIASNNSFGINKGKFTKNYTLSIWKRRYKDTLGLNVFIYRKI